MHLIQILLPSRDAKGRGFPEAKYDVVAAELTDRYGGITAYTRTPAEGRWKPGSEAASLEDVVVFEVMVEAVVTCCGDQLNSRGKADILPPNLRVASSTGGALRPCCVASAQSFGLLWQ